MILKKEMEKGGKQNKSPSRARVFRLVKFGGERLCLGFISGCISSVGLECDKTRQGYCKHPYLDGGMEK